MKSGDPEFEAMFKPKTPDDIVNDIVTFGRLCGYEGIRLYQRKVLEAMVISEGAYRYLTLPAKRELANEPDLPKPSHKRTPLDRAAQGREARAAMLARARK